MAETAGLADAFLESCPALQWITDTSGAFQRIYGDPAPLFGESAAQLLGRRPNQIWVDRFARALAGETLYFRERRGVSLWNISIFPIASRGTVHLAGAIAQLADAWGSVEAQLRHTVFRALDTAESDRKAMASFMHDSLGQTLTALGLRLDLARMDLEAGSPEVGDGLSEIQRILGQMMEDVRQQVNKLSPSTVERSGLAPAIERLAGHVRKRFSGVLQLHVDPTAGPDAKTAAALYHVVQEAIENALKHSDCSTLKITVKTNRTGTTVEVADNGRGFDSRDWAGGCPGMGLLSMEHYAAQAGLELSVVSSRNSGTVVRASKATMA